MQWTSGQHLQNGKYTIVKVLGEGGFGITYLANSKEYGQVVIKTVNETVQKRPDFDEFQDDFVNEALKIRGCQHPHIVKVHKMFREKVRHPNPGNSLSPCIRLDCMVMEFIEGMDLAERVLQRGCLPEQDALRYVAQVGEALSVVHGNGLLHRDVKPQNIMVRQANDEAVLIDFGIAREFTPNVTHTHTQFLTEGYAPIEQYDLREKRGPFTDVYGLAATLYCLLTGQVPVGSQTRMIQSLQQQQDGLKSPQTISAEVSDRVNAAVMKGMELRPEYRPQTMAEWLELLGVWSYPTPQAAVPPMATSPQFSQPPHSLALSLGRRGWLKWVGVSGVGMAAGLFWRLWTSDGDGGTTGIIGTDVPDDENGVTDELINDGLDRAETGSEPALQPESPWDKITLDKEAVGVNSQGTITKSYLVTVDTYVEALGNGVKFRMVQIPGGSFEMGQTEAEKQALMRQVGEDNYQFLYANELPRHSVTVPTFFMGMMTVTQALYEAVMGRNPATNNDRVGEVSENENRFVAPNQPVINVSWHDAIAFCKKLSDRTGNSYRLPSEAEWEYACRAGTTTPFHFGETITTAIANYNGFPYENAPEGDSRGRTTQVGSFPPNAFGLFDMHGNVWEWCADHWHENYDDAPTDGSAWVTGGYENLRLLRGGSWYYEPSLCRSAYRLRNNVNNKLNDIGFRVVCSVPRTL